MRHSHEPVASPCAQSASRIDLETAQNVPEPRFSRGFVNFLLSVATARALANRDPAQAARTLSDWIGRDG